MKEQYAIDGSHTTVGQRASIDAAAYVRVAALVQESKMVANGAEAAEARVFAMYMI